MAKRHAADGVQDCDMRRMGIAIVRCGCMHVVGGLFAQDAGKDKLIKVFIQCE